MQFAETLAQIGFIIVAMVGGIAKHLTEYIRSDRVSVGFGNLAAHAVVSGFSGYMFAHVALLIRPEWALIAAGIGGYMGTQALELAVDIIKSRLGKKP